MKGAWKIHRILQIGESLTRKQLCADSCYERIWEQGGRENCIQFHDDDEGSPFFVHVCDIFVIIRDPPA